MSHHCQAALITCEDFRLHQRSDGRNYIADFIKALGCDADLITRAGAVQDLFRPAGTNFDKSVFRDLDVSIKLHQAKEIYLVNHTDCGAYSKFDFSGPEQEKEQHRKDLRAARELIMGEYPHITVKMFLLELEAGTEDVFKPVEVN